MYRYIHTYTHVDRYIHTYIGTAVFAICYMYSGLTQAHPKLSNIYRSTGSQGNLRSVCKNLYCCDWTDCRPLPVTSKLLLCPPLALRQTSSPDSILLTACKQQSEYILILSLYVDNSQI